MRYIIILTLILGGCTNQTSKPDLNNKTLNADTIRVDSLAYPDEIFRSVPVAERTNSVTLIFTNHTLRYKKSDFVKDMGTVTEGSYTTDRGYKDDDDATVYVLDDDKPEIEQRYLKISDDTILQLSPQGEIINYNAMYKLVRVKN